ncbi:ferredoxin [Nocardia bovistercoris]|uniref:Ferredoxin n=1 Tax=Nocardia bovistercoris TaxID=2785916 RepID=A0A931IFX8_9NOCA|nr:ferredoxin [Nocardia bovistercoris]MBH0779625.1 ferredoxin [Nocardia bovistercoris]
MSEEQWRITVDRTACLGSGMCVGVAPSHFSLVDGLSSPRREHAPPDTAVVEAAESCPVEAILVTSAESGATIAPE